jgi:hypothetical protein
VGNFDNEFVVYDFGGKAIVFPNRDAGMRDQNQFHHLQRKTMEMCFTIADNTV